MVRMIEVIGHRKKSKKGKPFRVKPSTRKLKKNLEILSDKPYDMIEGTKIFGFRDASGKLMGEPITVVQDWSGNLHIWNGIKKVEKTGSQMYKSAGKQADLFVEFDVAETLSNFPKEAQIKIKSGNATFVSLY